jgi:alanine racemase
VALRARLLRVYDLPPGTAVGYGRSYRAERRVRAALVPTGYADGVPRAHAGRATALLHGRRMPLIGRVSMDQCVVDVTNVPRARVGDVVTLFGPDADAEISLEEFAGWSDTIGHEALCRVGSRVPRLYREDGKTRWAGVASSDHALPEATFSLP